MSYLLMKEIFISKINPKKNSVLKINQLDKGINNPIKLKFSISKNVNINKSNNIAQLDFEKLEYPLILRRWKIYKKCEEGTKIKD